MKHFKTLSVQKPAEAQEVAWVELKDIIATNYTKAGVGQFVGGGGNMSREQVNWLAAQWDNALQK